MEDMSRSCNGNGICKDFCDTRLAHQHEHAACGVSKGPVSAARVKMQITCTELGAPTIPREGSLSSSVLAGSFWWALLILVWKVRVDAPKLQRRTLRTRA